jgi:NAD(P)H-dependent flavin oxidoreductase YrpB (nitropropane dioxygenase family)
MQTPLRELLQVEFPIVAFSHCRDVVAAVSKAGGFGVLGVTALSPEQLQIELDWIEKQVGEHPYGIDVLLPVKYVGSDSRGDAAVGLEQLIPAEHRRFVDALLTEHGVPPLPDASASDPAQVGDMHARQRELVDVALSNRAALIASALGPAPAWLIEKAHAQGLLVAGLVGKKQHALSQKAAGVDIVIAQGYEAGGHTGEIASMVLTPEVVDAVAPLPVLAAGGIASGRQMAAALALGAQGVWTGSVWLTTEEAETHPVVKEKFLAASSSDTLRSRSLTGKPARQLRSAWTDAWADPANPEPLGMPLQMLLVREAQLRIQRTAHHPGSGAEKLINYFVGQVVGSMNQVKSVRAVIAEIVEEYVDTLERMNAWTRG